MITWHYPICQCIYKTYIAFHNPYRILNLNICSRPEHPHFLYPSSLNLLLLSPQQSHDWNIPPKHLPLSFLRTFLFDTVKFGTILQHYLEATEVRERSENHDKLQSSDFQTEYHLTSTSLHVLLTLTLHSPTKFIFQYSIMKYESINEKLNIRLLILVYQAIPHVTSHMISIFCKD